MKQNERTIVKLMFLGTPPVRIHMQISEICDLLIVFTIYSLIIYKFSINI